jgi:hypothetical protein
LFGKGEFNGFLDKRRFHDSLVRCFGSIMVFNGFRADSFFSNKFYGRAEEVMKEFPFFGIEVIKEGNNTGII